MLNEKYLSVYRDIELPPAEFFILILVYEENFEFLHALHTQDFMHYDGRIKSLEEQGLIKSYGENISDVMLRKKGEELFKRYIKKKRKIDVTLCIDEWRKLFPAGSNNGGYRYRGNKLEVIKKMTKFVSIYNYTREEIFKATQNYIQKFAIKGYMYMQLAHYFIDKQGVGSSLASECEALKEKPIKVETGYGGKLI